MIFFVIFRRVVLIKSIDYSQTLVDYAFLVTSVTQFLPVLDHKTRTGILNEGNARKHSAGIADSRDVKTNPRSIYSPKGANKTAKPSRDRRGAAAATKNSRFIKFPAIRSAR